MKRGIKKLKFIISFGLFLVILVGLAGLYAEETQKEPNGYIDIIRVVNTVSMKEQLPIIFDPFTGKMTFVIKADQFKVGDKFRSPLDNKEYTIVLGGDGKLTAKP